MAIAHLYRSLSRKIAIGQCGADSVSMKSLSLQIEPLNRASPQAKATAPVRPEAVEQQRRISIRVSATQDRATETVRIVGNIRLMEGWTSNNPDVTFKNQTFEIRQETRAARIGIDGRLSVTCSPKNITWYGGNPADLERVVHVKIVSRGAILVDDAICTQNGQPKEVPGGVSFEVMEV
jgi:hypothetical protein